MEKEIRKILEYTAIAPSSHNTQPWFVSVKNSTILIGADFDRALKHSDPDNRELYISIGAALQNTLYAAEALGFEFDLNYFPEKNKEIVAKVEVKPTGKKSENTNRLELMSNRHSNRNFYYDRNIPKEIIDKWQNLVKDLGVSVNVVRDKKRKELIGKEVEIATKEAMANPNFRDELSRWIRHNLTKSHDGMPGYGMNIPTIPSLFSSFIIKKFNVGTMQAKTENRWIVKSPVVVILSGSEKPQNLVKTGQAYERIILDATSKNIKSATLTAAIEIGNHYKNLKKIIDITERPLVMFRLGYCDKIPKPTPKRTVEEILRI